MSRALIGGGCFWCVLFLGFFLFFFPVSLFEVFSIFGHSLPLKIGASRWILLYSVVNFYFCSPIFGKYWLGGSGFLLRAWVGMAFKQLFVLGVYFCSLFLLFVFVINGFKNWTSCISFFEVFFQGFICWILLCLYAAMGFFFFRKFFLFGAIAEFAVLFSLPISMIAILEVLLGSLLFFFGGILLCSTWNNLSRTRGLRCDRPTGRP